MSISNGTSERYRLYSAIQIKLQRQGWVFALAKILFARTVEKLKIVKTGNDRQKLAKSLVHETA